MSPCVNYLCDPVLFDGHLRHWNIGDIVQVALKMMRSCETALTSNDGRALVCFSSRLLSSVQRCGISKVKNKLKDARIAKMKNESKVAKLQWMHTMD